MPSHDHVDFFSAEAPQICREPCQNDRVNRVLLLWLQIFEHILIHGDIRKTTKLAVAGEEVEVEEFVEEEDEDTVKHSTTALAKRESFVNMGKNLKQKVGTA